MECARDVLILDLPLAGTAGRAGYAWAGFGAAGMCGAGRGAWLQESTPGTPWIARNSAATCPHATPSHSVTESCCSGPTRRRLPRQGWGAGGGDHDGSTAYYGGDWTVWSPFGEQIAVDHVADELKPNAMRGPTGHVHARHVTSC